MITGLDYWYDSQTRRFLEQIVKAFSGYQFMTGRRGGEEPQLRMVPCRMAQRNRMVAHIINNNSENVINTVPLITVDHTNTIPRREDLQNIAHVDKRVVTEREIDSSGNYTGNQGNRVTVERLMPRPFTMEVQIDIWTSNLDQKHQLMEQILTVIYPSIVIQNSDNALDWAARTEIAVDSITWSSRSVPIGTDNEIDIATITLTMPFWLNPPAKVTRQKLINQINTNVGMASIEQIVTNVLDGTEQVSQSIVTPGNHAIEVNNGILTLLGEDATFTDPSNNPWSWADLLALYGLIHPTISQIRLKTGDIETGPEIIGTIQATGEVNKLAWTIDPDTLPTNSFAPVIAMIEPMRTWPGNGLPVASNGDRYLITQDIGPSQAWGSLTAGMDDIIQYSSGAWTVVFDASDIDEVKHVVNTYTGRQLRWTGMDWVLSIDGTYGPGKWRVHL